MQKTKLALIGKNISQSRSQLVYEEILQREIDYSLIDVKTTLELPELDFIMNEFDGLSITSPYKKSYLDKVQIEGEYKLSINAIKYENGILKAINTDYLAIQEILNNRFIKQDNFIILGDGAMAQLLLSALRKNKPEQISRNNGRLINNLQITQKNSIVINTCLKDFAFSTSNPENISTFWSLNYNNPQESDYCLENKIPYMDGMELLNLQAKYALKFWNIH